jgi:hypothetical protein
MKANPSFARRVYATVFEAPHVIGAQALLQWVQGDLFPGIKRPGLEADHSSSAEVKNVRAMPQLSHTSYCMVHD